MVESSKITERATQLAGQAVEAAGPLVVKAKEVAVDLAGKAVPYVEKAGVLAAQGVSTLAGNVDRATGGKYSAQISSVTSKVRVKHKD